MENLEKKIKELEDKLDSNIRTTRELMLLIDKLTHTTENIANIALISKKKITELTKKIEEIENIK